MKVTMIRSASAALLAVLASAALAAGPAMRTESTRTMGSGARTATTTTQPTTTTTRGPTTTGQPNQECGSATAPSTPGNSATAPGSAFNPSGKSGSVYAGEQPQNSRNTASVSQYDVACARP